MATRGLMLLQPSDFYIGNHPQRGPQMCTKIPGLSIVMYFTPECQYCIAAKDAFQRLPQYVRHVQFAMANAAADNKAIFMLSLRTKEPIAHVPYIRAYVDGVPVYDKYKGPRTLDNFAKFATEISSSLSSGRPYVPGPQGAAGGQCVGQECGDDDVCLMTYEETYLGAPTKPSGSTSKLSFSEVYGR